MSLKQNDTYNEAVIEMVEEAPLEKLKRLVKESEELRTKVVLN